MRPTLPVAVAAALALSACGRPPEPVDLLGAGDRLVEAPAAGEGREAVLEAAKRGLRLNDVIHRGFPAGPPGRLRFALDIPKGAHLQLACAIDPRFHERPGVEFVVKVKRDGREEVVWTQLLDPISHPEHRAWVPVDVDLAKHAGRGRELVLETHGYEQTGEAERAWWGTPALTVDRKAPLAIVYLVDTLRADHTGVYGYSRKTTPELDAFARDAVVFDAAVVHASWTKPSVASILTSRLPGQHRAVQLRDPLDPSNVTLAERLDARGWATGAAIANSVIYGAESEFDRGFDVFAGLHGDDDRRSKLVGADVVVDSALAFLRSRRGMPTFLYVHTMDPHVPYAPPPPFDRMFEPFPTRGAPRARPAHRLQGAARPGAHDRAVRRRHRVRGPRVRPLRPRAEGGGALRGRARRLPRRPRRGVPRPRALAPRPQPLRRAHPRPAGGEVPRRREGAGRRVAGQVQGLDVVPTVLEAMGVPLAADLGGQPLQRALAGGTKPRPALAEISHRGFVAHGVRTDERQVRPTLQPRRRRALLRPRARPEGEDERRRGEAPERVRLLQAQAEAGMSPNPFRYVVQVAGPGRFALKLETRGWLEGVEATGLGPQERSSVGGNGRWLELRLAAAPRRAARDRASRCDRWGRRSRSPARATGGRCVPADVAVGEGSFRPRGLPLPAARHRVRDGERPRHQPLRRPAAGRPPACACGSPCPRAARSGSSTPRRASG